MAATWLASRPACIPVSLLKAARRRTEVSRRPFISISALPVRTRLTAIAAAEARSSAWMISKAEISRPLPSQAAAAAFIIASLDPTRTGSAIPAFQASDTASSTETSWAAATAIRTLPDDAAAAMISAMPCIRSTPGRRFPPKGRRILPGQEPRARPPRDRR